MKRMSSCHKDGSIIISMCSIISTIFLLQSKNQAELKSKKNWCSILFGLQHFFSWELHNSTIYNGLIHLHVVLLLWKTFPEKPKFKASGDRKWCHFTFWLSIIGAGQAIGNNTQNYCNNNNNNGQKTYWLLQ